jgi:hypothetical protein
MLSSTYYHQYDAAVINVASRRTTTAQEDFRGSSAQP